ncbi:MAG: hypothetical protein AB7O60_00415 [Variibacter sp.]
MLRFLHAGMTLALALAVPAAIYAVNGGVEPWAFGLGGVVAFSYWYFGPWFF